MRNNWKNLKENLCPVCSNKIERSEKSDYDCMKCGFFCRYQKGQEIIADINKNMSQKDRDKMTDDWLATHEK